MQSFGPVPILHPFHLWEGEEKNETELLNTNINERLKRVENCPDKKIMAFNALLESNLDPSYSSFLVRQLAFAYNSVELEQIRKFVRYYKENRVQENKEDKALGPSKIVAAIKRSSVQDFYCDSRLEIAPTPPKAPRLPAGPLASVGIYQTSNNEVLTEFDEFVAGTVSDTGTLKNLSFNETIIHSFKQLSEQEQSQIMTNALLSLHQYGKYNMAATANAMASWSTANEGDDREDYPTVLHVLKGQLGPGTAYIVLLDQKGNQRIKKISTSGTQTTAIGHYDQMGSSPTTPNMIKEQIPLQKGERAFIVMLSHDFMGERAMSDQDIANNITRFHWSPYLAAMRLAEIAVQRKIPGMKTALVRQLDTNPNTPTTALDAMFCGISGNKVAKELAKQFVPHFKSACNHPQAAPPYAFWAEFRKKYFVNVYQDDQKLEEKIIEQFFDEKAEIKTEHASRWEQLKKLDTCAIIYSDQFFETIKKLLFPIGNSVDGLFYFLIQGAANATKRDHATLYTVLLDATVTLLQTPLEKNLHQLAESIIKKSVPSDGTSHDEKKLQTLLQKKLDILVRLNQLDAAIKNSKAQSFMNIFGRAFYNYAKDLYCSILNTARSYEDELHALAIVSDTIEHTQTALHQPTDPNIQPLEVDIQKINQMTFQSKNPDPGQWRKFLGITFIMFGIVSFIAGIAGFAYTGGASAFAGSKFASYLISSGLALLGASEIGIGYFFLNQQKKALVDQQTNIAANGVSHVATAARKNLTA